MSDNDQEMQNIDSPDKSESNKPKSSSKISPIVVGSTEKQDSHLSISSEINEVIN